MGSRKKDITWGTNLYEKLIEGINSLWTKQNLFEHDRKLHEVWEAEDIRLKTSIGNSYKLGKTALEKCDKYVFNNKMLKLWSNNGAYIRSYLATVLIAREIYQEVKLELGRLRGNME